MTHIMLDLETMGTAPGCAIVSIGAVAFDVNYEKPLLTSPQFYVNVDLKSCTKAGLTLEADTVMWWMQQSQEARSSLVEDPTPLEAALTLFAEFYDAIKGRQLWCHGATFDAPILEAAYKKLGLSVPWKFPLVRDTRTLFELAAVQVVRDASTHHNALSDALAQAEAVRRAYAKLGVQDVFTRA